MKVGRIPLMCVLALFATVASTTSAYAQTFVIVLLDATGSMSTQTNGQSRFQAAASAAAQELANLDKVHNDLRVDVYTFRDLGAPDPMTEHTPGFVDPIDINSGNDVVIDLIKCVGGINDPSFHCSSDLPQNIVNQNPAQSFPVVPGGITPLADAMCRSFDKLVNTPTKGGILIVSSDGLENASTNPPPTGCQGTLDAVFTQGTGWPLGSWQQNVINHFTSVAGNPVHVDPQVFLTPVTGLPFGPPPDVETGLPSRAPAFAVSAAAATDIDPLQQFFLSLAQAVGGRVRVFTDNQPAPLFADVNGGQCVDITDAIDVARAFGQPAFGSDFDLSLDGKIGFEDYQLVTQSATPGCGTANPYTPRDPVVCKGAKRIVIDGQSIADGGITIDVRGACDIIIKNSFIVSGQNAITIVGSALITVDNSIIVGENAVITQHGAGVLSAANSVFHGTIDTHGAFQYIDRGGNKFE
jgi:hypothetical protein